MDLLPIVIRESSHGAFLKAVGDGEQSLQGCEGV